MAGKTAILSVRITGNAKGGVRALAETAAAATGLKRVTSSVSGAVSGMVRNTPKIAAVALAAANVGSAVIASAGGLLSFGASLASIAPAALALPGVLAGLGTGAVVLALSLKDAGQYLGDLAPQFAALQGEFSPAFWAQAAAPIRALATGVLPVLSAGLPPVAAGMGKVVAAMASAAGSSRGLAQIGGILHQTAAGAVNAAGGAGAFTSALMTIASVGSTYLPALGSWFTNLGTQFNGWTNRVTADGSLRSWIDTGISGLQMLGSIVGSVAGIFASLARAAVAAGGGGLGAVAAGLSAINTAAAGPAFQGALTTVFQGAFSGIAALAPGVSALGSAFMALAPALSQVMTMAGQAASLLLTALGGALAQVGPGLTAAFSGILQGVTGLTPALSALGPLASSVFTLFGSVAATVLPLIGQLFAALAPVVMSLATALTPLVQVLGAGLSAALAMILPPVTQFATSLIPMLAAAFTSMVPVLAPLSAQLMQLGATLLSTLLPVITQLVAAVLPIFMQLVTALAPAFTAVATAIMPLVAMLVGQLAPVFMQLVTAILPPLIPVIQAAAQVIVVLVQAFMPLVQIILGMVIPIITQLLSVVTTVFSGLATIITGALTIVTGIINVFAGVLTGNWSQVWQGLGQIVSGAWSVITGIIQTAISLVVGIITTLASVVVSLFTSLWSMASSIVSSAWAGITGAVSAGIAAVIGFISSMASSVVSFISNAWSTARALVAAGMSAIASAVASGIGQVISFFSSLPGRITGALAGVAGMLQSVGVQMIQGLIGGIQSMAGAVAEKARSVVAGAVNAAKAALGIHSPSRVFRGIGEFTVAGLVQGLTRKQSDAKTATKNLAKGITQVYQRRAEEQRKRLKRRSILGDPKAQAAAFFNTYARASTEALQRMASQRERLLSKLDKQKKHLSDLYKERADKAASLRDSYIGSFDLGEASKKGIGGLINGAKRAATIVGKLRKNMWLMRSRGFSPRMIDDLAGMDPADALKISRKILTSSGAQQAQLRKQYGRLTYHATKTSTAISHSMYQTGIDAARGLVNGIQSQLKSVDLASSVLASRLVGTVRRRLGIHSPSRVFRDQVGAQIGAGLAAGLVGSTGQVAAAARTMLKAVDRPVTKFNRQAVQLSPNVRGAAVPAAQSRGNTTHVTVEFNGLVTDRIGTAREILRVIDDYNQLRGVTK